MTTFEQEIAAQDASAQRHLEELAYSIATINETLKPLEDAKKKYVDELKQLMALGDLTEVTDGEHGITARLQERSGTPTFDLITAVKNGDDGALIEAAAAGMVRLDTAMFKKFRKDAGASWADALAKYEGPGQGAVALIVETKK